MLLLGKQSTSCNVLGSVAISVVEFVMRASKMMVLLYQTQRRKIAVERAAAELSARCSSENNSLYQDQTSSSGETATSLTKFEHWKKQVVDHHTAEVMADIYAECVAIDCSASILYFMWDNPKYI